MENAEPVGYHSWFNPHSVAMFILGDSLTLHTASLGEEAARQLADNIGRTLRKHPLTGQVLFVDKTQQPWKIAILDPQSGAIGEVMQLFPGVEDFEVGPAGRFWTGNGARLYRSNAANNAWELAADLSEFGISNITRLGVSPDDRQLALVSSE